MSEKEGIRSSTKFLWQLILELLKFPFTLIMVLVRKKEVKDLFGPFKEILKFIVEARLTLSLVIINVIIFFSLGFMVEQMMNVLINYPKDLFSSRAWSLITSGFLHANLSHLLGNMLALFLFGRVVEKELGTGKMFLSYFGALMISGVFSSVISLFIMNDNTPGLGASGAIMGLVATAILVSPFTISYEAIIPMPVMFLGWLTIWADITGLINPTADGIGHLAHLGGFISVAIIAFILGEDKKKLWRGFLINLGCLAVAGLVWFFVLKGKT
ncbi:TPA: rhomboid family intramembrane serine protease [Candidatus Woesearchaeota archaeon]|nr:rhomboid family intramembrane serine protease [Candidatus Woesearchaeota archaeon]